MRRRKQPEYIRGTPSHRRTEGDYLGVLLENVDLGDWRDVITNTLEAAKGGDEKARDWLSKYLMGAPSAKAPTPLTVVVNQLSGADEVVERLAQPHVDRATYPLLHQGADFEDAIKARIVKELEHATARPDGDSGE